MRDYGVFTVREIADGVGTRMNHASAIMGRLRNNGLLTKVGYNAWMTTCEQKRALSGFVTKRRSKRANSLSKYIINETDYTLVSTEDVRRLIAKTNVVSMPYSVSSCMRLMVKIGALEKIRKGYFRVLR